ncbi:ABC transporter permease [Paraoerskovia sediminicola]|uniref:ABC transporter permease n=1 Tax=Paraoerskovia sediminicola TaxID=1138587 RepID=A0ABM8G460_9CELL|nr:FtsX-like permease family protein [Paraoerskovia sediminicola]BDZ42828.1 ABC transporter permease [Paraoerskovia sediminicola]
MIRLTLAQMRRSLGRLSAAGVAIVLGTAFVAATILAGGILTSTLTGTFAARYADADLVVTRTMDTVTADQVATVAKVPGVASAELVLYGWAEIGASASATLEQIVPTHADPAFEPLELIGGRFPTSDDEIALTTSLADRNRVGLGDEVPVTYWEEPAGGTDDADLVEVSGALRVVGTVDDPHGAYSGSGGAAVVTPDTFDSLYPGASDESEAAVLRLAPGASAATVAADVEAAAPGSSVRTTEVVARDAVSSGTGEQDVFTAVVLAFAAVAMIVAALVIANTFQVLVAQRTRTLALLRCVGADRRQLGRSVVLEATVLGLGASVVGVLAGAGLTQLALSVAGWLDLGLPLPSAIDPSTAFVLVPLIVGTVVTVLASLAPARAATRVAPLAALRPAAPVARDGHAGRGRTVLAAGLLVVGVALLVLGVGLGRAGEPGPGLAAGVLGGGLSFTGLLVGAVLWVPSLAALGGRAVAKVGPSGVLAAANAVRNPRRTAATTSALLIGVTLVTTMATGAAAARASLTAELDGHYPVDVAITGTTSGTTSGTELTAQVERDVLAVDGVAGAALLPGAPAVTVARDESATAASSLDLLAIDPQDATEVLRDPTALDMLDEGRLAVPTGAARDGGLKDGDHVTVSGTGGAPVDLEVLVVAVPATDTVAFVTPATLADIEPDATPSALWVRLTDDADVMTAVGQVQDSVAGLAVQVTSPAAERASFDRTIDTMLAVVVGLLAVAVVIAIIGVANTLSLSVLERRRESATLRAVGLSRVQLRAMLAFEGSSSPSPAPSRGSSSACCTGGLEPLSRSPRSVTWFSRSRGGTCWSSWPSRSSPGCSPASSRVGRRRAPRPSRRWPWSSWSSTGPRPRRPATRSGRPPSDR